MNLLQGVRIALFASASLVMALGFTPSAVAQGAPQDACGVLVEVAQGQPPNNGGFPFNYAADGGGVNKQEAGPPMPGNPIKKVCERGAVEILMGNGQHFGHRIGDRIPVTVIITTAPHVVLDFTSLTKQGKLSFEPSDFELFGEPQITTETASNGVKRHTIQLGVQSFVMKEEGKVITLRIDLRYSTELAEDGKTREWKILSTPDFVVTRSLTVDHGNELLEGDLKKQPLSLPWLTYVLLIAGMVSLFSIPGFAAIKYLNRVRTRKNPPAERVAWAVFDDVLSEVGTMNGFTLEHYVRIDAAFRKYLEAKLEVPVASATIPQIHDRLSHLEEFDKIALVIKSCERVIYNGEQLDENDNYEIVQAIKELVPRSWDAE